MANIICDNQMQVKWNIISFMIVIGYVFLCRGN